MNVDLEARSLRAPGRLLLALVLLALVVVPIAYEAIHRGHIFPGVSVSGIPIGGLAPTHALGALVEAGLDPNMEAVLVVEDQEYLLPTGSSGLALDLRATVEEAYAVGRSGARPLAWLDRLIARTAGRRLQPQVAFDADIASNAVAGIAAQFDRPAQDASIAFDGINVRTVEPMPGRELNRPAAVALLAEAADSGRWPINGIRLPTTQLEPTVGDAGPAARAAEALLAGPLTLRSAEHSWTLHRETLAGLLTTEVHDREVVLAMNSERFVQWMEPITQVISRTAESPRFRFNPESSTLRLVRPGQSGRLVDLAATADRILGEATDTDRLVRIAVVSVPPSVRDGVTAEELGIRELIHEETSRYAGSPSERKHNIALAASRFDGLLVPSDAILSFNEHVGDISEEEGYQETKIIMDGATADGVGGGVCQVSTTLFRAAFWSGLPIVERLPHGYRVAYYEQSAPVGLDATVFSPLVDLKVKNDTGAWILIETESDADAATVTFRFFGAALDREVQMEGPVITDEVPPPEPRTVVDPDLEPGQIEKRELPRNGASVTVTRIVRRGDEESREVFRSTYRPTGALTAIGPPPGWEPPEDGSEELVEIVPPESTPPPPGE